MFETNFLIPVIGILSSAILLIIALFNSLAGPHLKNYSQIEEQPLVSILVPARNEEKNLATCLESLVEQNYKNYEN